LATVGVGWEAVVVVLGVELESQGKLLEV